MTSETFEQVLAAAEADGAFSPAWMEFLDTRFFVPVLPAPGGDALNFSLELAQHGSRSLLISEVRERVSAHTGAVLAALLGADIVSKVPQLSS